MNHEFGGRAGRRAEMKWSECLRNHSIARADMEHWLMDECRKVLTPLAAVVLLFLSVQNGVAQSTTPKSPLSPEAKAGVAEFADDLSRCAAYYTIMKAAYENRGKQTGTDVSKTVALYQRAITKLTMFSRLAGKAIDVSPDETKAGIKQHLEKMSAAMDGNFGRIAKVQDENDNDCADLIANFNKRLQKAVAAHKKQ